jgi:hypothetical protein
MAAMWARLRDPGTYRCLRDLIIEATRPAGALGRPRGPEALKICRSP